MDIALHVDVVICVVRKRTAQSLPLTIGDNALHCDATGVLISDIKRGSTSTQVAGELNGNGVSFGNIHTSRVEAEIQSEVIPHIVGAIRCRTILHHDILDDPINLNGIVISGL